MAKGLARAGRRLDSALAAAKNSLMARRRKSFQSVLVVAGTEVVL